MRVWSSKAGPMVVGMERERGDSLLAAKAGPMVVGIEGERGDSLLAAKAGPMAEVEEGEGVGSFTCHTSCDSRWMP